MSVSLRTGPSITANPSLSKDERLAQDGPFDSPHIRACPRESVSLRTSPLTHPPAPPVESGGPRYGRAPPLPPHPSLSKEERLAQDGPFDSPHIRACRRMSVSLRTGPSTHRSSRACRRRSVSLRTGPS